MGLTLRKFKATKLTTEELDNNFLYLESLIKKENTVSITFDDYQELIGYKNQVEKGISLFIIESPNETKEITMVPKQGVPKEAFVKLNNILEDNRTILRLLAAKHDRINDTLLSGKLPGKRPSLYKHIKDWFKKALWRE